MTLVIQSNFNKASMQCNLCGHATNNNPHSSDIWNSYLASGNLTSIYVETVTENICLTHCSLVTPYTDTIWWHQAITRTNVNFSLVSFYNTRLRYILQSVPKPQFCEMSLKIILWKLLPHLTGASELYASHGVKNIIHTTKYEICHVCFCL